MKRLSNSIYGRKKTRKSTENADKEKVPSPYSIIKLHKSKHVEKIIDPSFNNVLNLVKWIKSSKNEDFFFKEFIVNENTEEKSESSKQQEETSYFLKAPTFCIEVPPYSTTPTYSETNVPNIIRSSNNGSFPIINKPAFYVREQYKDIYRLLINNSSTGSRHKFVVTGTSGIGKSCFLIYLLIRLLCEYNNVTIICQFRSGNNFYCFNGSSVSIGSLVDFVDYFRCSETWYLVDGVLQPEDVEAKTIIALSPRSIKKDEFQEFDKVIVKKFYMGPWTLDECLICQKYIFPKVPLDIMLELYDKAGGVPRYILQRVEEAIKYYNSETTEGREQVIRLCFDRITEAILEVRDFVDILNFFTESGETINLSNRIVHRLPNLTYDNYRLGWASNFVFNEIQKKLEFNAWKDVLDKVRDFTKYPSTRGIMFELYATHLFMSGNNRFETRKLSSIDNTNIIEEYHIENQPKVDYIRTSEEPSRHHENKIILPSKSNFGAADLFIMQNNIFQITVSQKHLIKQEQLINIIKNMPAYLKDTNSTIRLYFVVPDDIYRIFKQQDIVTQDTETKTFRKVKSLHYTLRNVEQWVLKIGIDMNLR